MKIGIQKKIQAGLLGAFLILACSECAYISEKEPEEKQVAEPVQPAPVETKPTPSVDLQPPMEEKPIFVGERIELPPLETELPPIEIEPQPIEIEPPPLEAELPPIETRFEHTVKWPGETLSIIARWYTGKTANWKALQKANPNLNPNRIFIGNQILIPEDLLKTREHMPKEFLAQLASKRKTKALPLKASDTTPLVEGETELLPKTARFEHTVKWPRETLSSIAEWYTGKANNWKALAEANPKLNPDRILIGSKIVIPEELLKTREPMPMEYAAELSSQNKPKVSPPESSPAPKEEEEPELIGPKEYHKR